MQTAASHAHAPLDIQHSALNQRFACAIEKTVEEARPGQRVVRGFNKEVCMALPLLAYTFKFHLLWAEGLFTPKQNFLGIS